MLESEQGPHEKGHEENQRSKGGSYKRGLQACDDDGWVYTRYGLDGLERQEKAYQMRKDAYEEAEDADMQNELYTPMVASG